MQRHWVGGDQNPRKTGRIKRGKLGLSQGRKKKRKKNVGPFNRPSKEKRIDSGDWKE